MDAKHWNGAPGECRHDRWTEGSYPGWVLVNCDNCGGAMEFPEDEVPDGERLCARCEAERDDCRRDEAADQRRDLQFFDRR